MPASGQHTRTNIFKSKIPGTNDECYFESLDPRINRKLKPTGEFINNK